MHWILVALVHLELPLEVHLELHSELDLGLKVALMLGLLLLGLNRTGITIELQL